MTINIRDKIRLERNLEEARKALKLAVSEEDKRLAETIVANRGYEPDGVTIQTYIVIE
jgi:hypothetical protein